MRVKVRKKFENKIKRNITRSKGRELVPIPMSSEKLKDLSSQVANLHKEMVEFEKNYSQLKKKSRIAIKEYRYKLSELMEELSKGVDYQVRDIIIEKDFDQRVVRRLLDGKILDEREMEKDDFQLDIFTEELEKKKIDFKSQVKKQVSYEVDKPIRHNPMPEEIKRGLDILNRIAVDVDG